MHVIQLAYQTDSRLLFEAIRHLPFACWLDSAGSMSGRYDIITAAPVKRWVTQGQHTTYFEHAKQTGASPEDPFSIVQQAYIDIDKEYGDTAKAHPLTKDLPFSGGLLGYFTYTLGRKAYQIPERRPLDCQLPDMVVGFYPWALIQDHQEKQCLFVSLPGYFEHDGSAPTSLDELLKVLAQNPSKSLSEDGQQISSDDSSHSDSLTISPLNAHITAPDYHRQIRQIQDYIEAGDTYQINFSQCFSGEYQGDPYLAYQELREQMQSPFSAFMDLGTQSILSLSPERFIKINKKQIVTQPIKGTLSRGKNEEEDLKNAQILLSSSKNQAENLMIVDLLRNDLGKTCVPGSIDVPALFALESYPNVHHLVSTVTGILSENTNPVDAFTQCFPGGSITGAPKKRAMEIIEELEQNQRSIYCGSIAYFSTNGNADSNITIRTIACDGNRLFCWGGGGIVADSHAEDEYQESLAKIGRILETLTLFQQ